MTDSGLSLGIVSDEISMDFGEAVEHAVAWGLRRLELRCLTSGRVPAISSQDSEIVRRLAERHGLRITALSPGIFKHPVSEREQLEREIGETLPATLALARSFGTQMIIVFGFKQQDQADRQDEQQRVVELLRRAAAVAAAEGCRLAIENEPGFVCDTGSRTCDVIRAVGSPWVGSNWDPCNAYGTDERPYPDGYLAVRPFIFNVHVKDTASGALIKCVPVGQGRIDWRGQLEALVRDRPVEHVTIETHCLPLIENSFENVRVLSGMLEEIRGGAAAHESSTPQGMPQP